MQLIVESLNLLFTIFLCRTHFFLGFIAILLQTIKPVLQVRELIDVHKQPLEDKVDEKRRTC